MRQERSQALFERAKKRIPGGVNSPVRAYKAVGRTPRFIVSAKGSRITDADGNEYIDYVCSFGPGILGHAPPAVVEAVRAACADGLSFGAPTEKEVVLAELVCGMMPSIELLRLVSSGTEAVMSAGLYGKGQNPEIQRLLSRTQRRPSGKGRFRSPHRGPSGQCGRTPGLHKEHAGGGL